MDNNVDFEKYKLELSICEKRISAVFKALCIVASFAGVVFIEMNTIEALETVGILYSCLLAFLLPLMVSMLIYIVKEAECFDVDLYASTKVFFNNAQQSYRNIFVCICFSGATSLVGLVILLLLVSTFSIKIPMKIISAIVAILWIVVGIFLKKFRFQNQLHFIFSSLTIICMLVSVFVFKH